MTMQFDEIKYTEETTKPSFKSGYHFHIDGSYEKESGVGSWGCVMINGSYIIESSGRVPQVNLGTTRNVGAELYAVIQALEYCRINSITAATIHYDYSGVELWPTGVWKAKNSITRNYRDIVKNSGITITWVHDKDSSYHTTAHKLANNYRVGTTNLPTN